MNEAELLNKNPHDNKAFRFPISVKGVIFNDEKVILLKNERDEWELPGGKLEIDETPEICVVREIEEELSIVTQVGPLLDTWVYHIHKEVVVFIVTYGCYPEPFSKVSRSPEHKEVGLFLVEEIQSLNMPLGYKNSIHRWLKLYRKEGN